MSGFSGRNAITQELIANLQSFQRQASDYAAEQSSQKAAAAQSKAGSFVDNIIAGKYDTGRENMEEFFRQRDQGNQDAANAALDKALAADKAAEKQMADDIAESYSDFTEDDFDFGGGYDYAAGGEIPEDDVDALIGGNEMIQSEGDESGFVGRPPSQVTDAESVADDKEMVAKEEGMVLNAEAVKLAGEQDVAAMIKEADDYLRKNGEEVEDTRELRTFASPRARCTSSASC